MDTAATTDSPVASLHFLDYWRVIRMRKSLILTVFLLCVITSSILTYCLPKQYSSTVRIEVQKDAPEVNIIGNQAGLQSWDPYYLTTQFRIITSWGILDTVISNLNLRHVFAEQDQAGEADWTPDQAYGYLYKRVGVDQTRGTSLIEIAVRNSDPKWAADIANKIAEVYKEYRKASWLGDRNRGIEGLRGSLITNQAALLVKQTNLDNLRSNLNVTEMENNPNAQASIIVETMRALENRRIDARWDYQDHSDTQSNLLILQTNGLLREALGTAMYRNLDPELAIKASDLSRAKNQFTEAQNMGYGPEHRMYVTALRDLEQASNAYEEKIKGIMVGLASLVNHDRGLLELIENEENRTKADAIQEAISNRDYVSAKRDLENTQRVVDDLHRLLIEQEAEAKQPTERSVVVHDPARMNKSPVSPKPFIIIPVGIVMGLVVGLGMAFFVEYLDTSVKTIDDVERSLQAPVLGVIPQNVGNVLDDGPESPHAEAYRVLRTNLLFGRKNEDWTTITVLSGGAGEGKTTTLFNLATVFAQNGQRILIVDSDLRRPSIHRMLRASNTTGLTDLLLNKQITLEQVIQKTKLPTLDFLPSGKLPSSSMSILGSVQMKEIVRDLKRRYDFIFFDSPPLLGVSDASILASEMDMVLQVIQYRRYPQPMTLRAKQMIQKVGGNLLGLVLNNINVSQDENYYYYSGYYEYEYRSSRNEPTVVQLSDAAAKAAKIDIKQKY
jgi:capsular exopolysaccharide synthesis family protein